jgi:hypothetical protein
MKYFSFLLFAAVCSSAMASSQNLGDFSPAQAAKLRVGCGKGEIRSITLLAKKLAGDSCDQALTIDSVAVSYDTGFKQFFEFPSGSTLTSANFRVLPGNKCLNGVAAKIKSRNASCNARVRVIVERQS